MVHSPLCHVFIKTVILGYNFIKVEEKAPSVKLKRWLWSKQQAFQGGSTKRSLAFLTQYDIFMAFGKQHLAMFAL